MQPFDALTLKICLAEPRSSTNTGMRRIATFRSTTDRIYDGGPVKFLIL
jgi:hypothetical protein